MTLIMDCHGSSDESNVKIMDARKALTAQERSQGRLTYIHISPDGIIK